MSGPENAATSRSEEERLRQEFENDPHEIEAREMAEKWRVELRERYPTPESAAKDYREGQWTIVEMTDIFNEEEIERLLNECQKLESEEE
ncbi:MAG: hypothetical protein AAB618_01495 [Patescibacteria group bacterium]